MLNQKKYIIYAENDQSFNSYFFKNGGVDVKSLYLDEVDEDEYGLEMEYNYKNYTPEEVLSVARGDKIYYDLKTTYNILSRRNCERISPGYNKRMTLTIFLKHTLEDDRNAFYAYFSLCKRAIYYANNYDLLNNNKLRIPLHHSG